MRQRGLVTSRNGVQPNRAAPRAADIAGQFDSWASTYESGRLSGWYQAQALLAFEHLDCGAQGKILDIGCATGWGLRHLARRRPDSTALGVDVSGAMVAAARTAAQAEALSTIEFLQLDWENPSEIGGPFDVILCLSVFHYFADPVLALRRMRSVLAEGGQVLLMERAMDHSLLTRIWNTLHRRLIRDHVSFASTRCIEAMAREAGFSRFEVLQHVKRMMWKSKLYTSLALIEMRA